MPRADDIHTIPEDLPVPEADGAADHLLNAVVPPIALTATTGETIRLDQPDQRTVLFCYPRTGRPDEELPPGWNAIPGARGCTPEACGFRDTHQQFADLGARVLALSTQPSDYQREMADRLHLPFPVLSDERLDAAQAPHPGDRGREDRACLLSSLPARHPRRRGARLAAPPRPAEQPLRPLAFGS